MKLFLSLSVTLIIVGFSVIVKAETKMTREEIDAYNARIRKINDGIMKTAKPGEVRLTYSEILTPEQEEAQKKKWREATAREEAKRKAEAALRERERQEAVRREEEYQKEKKAKNEAFARELRESIARSEMDYKKEKAMREANKNPARYSGGQRASRQ